MSQIAPRPSSTTDPAARYLAVRRQTQDLCAPLAAEDFVIQSMPDVSPTKWHIAHVTWFFETFLLKPHRSGYRVFHKDFEVLFNSYYNGVGEQFPRPRRGLLSRPTVKQVMDYRSHVDEAMSDWLIEGLPEELAPLLELGLNHEQQHQELLLMDIKHVLFQNPLHPAYRALPRSRSPGAAPGEPGWLAFDGGTCQVGHDGRGFAFDNEGPRHRVLLEPFELADRCINNAEYLAFIEDGGYRSALLWLSDGWSRIQQDGWRHPLYWLQRDGEWFEFTLSGLHPLDLTAPVTHLSLYEADAYASWAGARLPTEFEWERASAGVLLDGHFLDRDRLHPTAPGGSRGLRQLFGDVWEWTRSAYQPYPGFKAAAGAVGEYNGKFMCSQNVLRGGCCVTPASHVRASYRNFYYPHQRWPFTGVRLAR